MSTTELVLASASPRRRDLLAQIGLAFVVDPSGFDEDAADPGTGPAEWVRHLALQKARAVAVRRPHDLVLGADTVVVLDGEVLGKPRDAAAARAMLGRLSGRHHQVMTGVALVHGADGHETVSHEVTSVWMRHLEAVLIERYVNTGEPLDKAGAYAVQGRGAALVERIAGCYYNVVGLPLHRLTVMLAGFGIAPLSGGEGAPT